MSLLCRLFLAVLATTVSAQTVQITNTGNPIVSDGTWYSADPAPFVDGDTFYILTGRDSAGATQNDFVMTQWGLLSTTNPNPAGSTWTLTKDIAEPQNVFAWAKSGTSYAAQIVKGKNGRFYLYAPVTQKSTSSSDPFAIGVAVADNPAGPYTDAHPSGPIISQSTPSPGNNIQNIDPTVFVDDDGSAYIYFGTFGALRGYKLSADMTTPTGSVTTVNSLTGFFEAAWIFKRNSTYYMIYAANNAGASSPCTPTSYHACQAYGTASSPLGPWTFRGVILAIVSSTTSHSGTVQYKGKWYMTYHTADAVGGGHFRRSVAIDELTFDDTQSPPRINVVKQTFAPKANPQPTRNIAPKAKATSANATPIQYWIEAIHDTIVRANPLPPDYWSSYAAEQSPAKSTLTYTWNTTVILNGARMIFFADQPAGSNIGVPPPKSWSLEYLNSSGQWVAVQASTSYPVAVTDNPAAVAFTQITTTSLRAILNASGSGQYGGVGVKEFEALAPTAS